MRCNINKSCLTFPAAAAATVPIAASETTRTPRPFSHTMPRRRRPSSDNNATVENVLLSSSSSSVCLCGGKQKPRSKQGARRICRQSSMFSPSPRPLLSRRTNKSDPWKTFVRLQIYDSIYNILHVHYVPILYIEHALAGGACWIWPDLSETAPRKILR